MEERPPSSRTVAGRLISLLPGRHVWQLSQHLPLPLAPSIERTVNRSGGAEVHFATVEGADRYRLEVQRGRRVRNGSPRPRSFQSTLLVAGLPNGTKVHVRVVAFNRERESPPGDEYPLYVTAHAPDPPDGLDLRLAEGFGVPPWGRVLGVKLGVSALSRRKVGESSWTMLYSGPSSLYLDQNALGVRPTAEFPGKAANASSANGNQVVYEYAVARIQRERRGHPRSSSADTDPTSWRNWWPSGQGHTFKRQTAFWLPPYVPPAMVPPPTYPSK